MGLNQVLSDLRAVAHSLSHLDRARAIRGALRIASHSDDAGAVVRDYMRDVLMVEVTAAQAAELHHCGEARWLACAWQAADMRWPATAARDANLALDEDCLMAAIEAIWTDPDALHSAAWMREGTSMGVGIELYDPRASNAPPPAAYRDRRGWLMRRGRRRWQYKIGRGRSAPEWTALTVVADGDGDVLAEAPYLKNVRVGPTLRAALLGEPTDKLRGASQRIAHIRAAVSALRATEAAGRGWLSARLDLGDDAMRRLARLLRREGEV